MIDAIVHVGRHSHTANRNCFSISCPRGVCATSGWNCTPKICLPSCSSTAAGVSGVRAGTWKPSGARVMVSKCDIQTGSSAGAPSPRITDAPNVSSDVRPYSPRPVRATSPPSWSAISCAP